MASLCSQRQTVVLLMVAAMPLVRVVRARSSRLQRARGRPRSEEGSQARARTCTTTSGGESPQATGAREFLKAIQAVFEEALAPEADDLAAGVEALGDEAIGEALGGEEHHLGADYLEIRQRIAGGSVRASRVRAAIVHSCEGSMCQVRADMAYWAALENCSANQGHP